MYRFLRAVLASIGLLFVLATCTPLVSWYGRLLAGHWDEPRGAVLIVPLGSTISTAFTGQSSYWRAFHAVLAYRAGGFEEILVSGTGAEQVKTLLIAHGIPAAAVRVEPLSVSTRENATFTAALLAGDNRTKVLLTSDYHMFRAWRAFRKAGVAVSPRPIGDALKRANSWPARWPAFLDEVSETARIAYYFYRGWL